MDIIDEYLEAYRAQKAIEAQLAAAKQVTAEAKIRIVSYFTVENFDTVKRGDSSVNVSWRSFGKVVDYNAARGWVDKQDEPRSEYMEEVFIKGKKSDPRGLYAMVLDAQRESLVAGKAVQECLPPGIEIATVPVVTVRTARGNSKAKPEPTTALGKYMGEF